MSRMMSSETKNLKKKLIIIQNYSRRLTPMFSSSQLNAQHSNCVCSSPLQARLQSDVEVPIMYIFYFLNLNVVQWC